MHKVSVSRRELKSYAASNLAFFGLDLNRISSMFVAQIYRLEEGRVLDIYQILDEVKYLEGFNHKTLTGRERPFKGSVLNGCHKKHFTGARFILKNIALHLGCQNGNTRRLDQIVRQAFERSPSRYVDDDFISSIAHQTTVGAYEERARKGLTGEWVVFKKYEGKNYYLTLAGHDEGDENIRRRVEMAYEFDFPFLQENS